jgi:hypothetical protein
LGLKTRALSSQCAAEGEERWKAVLTEDEEDKLNENLHNNE